MIILNKFYAFLNYRLLDYLVLTAGTTFQGFLLRKCMCSTVKLLTQDVIFPVF